MRVLVLGETPLAEAVHGIIGDESVGMTSRKDGWPECDLAVSAGYRHIVPQNVLDRLPIVNIHTGYLPYNRGAYPNVWPLVDGTPAGVTIHWMDAGVDTGPIITQRQVWVDPWDTGISLDHRLKRTAIDLFWDVWPSIQKAVVAGPPYPSIPAEGVATLHTKAQLDKLTLNLDDTMTVRQVLNVLRARTYPPYPGVRFTEHGETWEVTVNARRID